jgi:citrate lyase synthetase
MHEGFAMVVCGGIDGTNFKCFFLQESVRGQGALEAFFITKSLIIVMFYLLLQSILETFNMELDQARVYGV